MERAVRDRTDAARLDARLARWFRLPHASLWGNVALMWLSAASLRTARTPARAPCFGAPLKNARTSPDAWRGSDHHYRRLQGASAILNLEIVLNTCT